MAALLCGCAADKPAAVSEQSKATPSPKTSPADSLADVLPDSEVEDALFKRAESSVKEEKADDEHERQTEIWLRRVVKKAHNAGDLQTEAERTLELGDFYRQNKRIHDAITHYRAAEQLGAKMPDDGGLRAHALAMAGEMDMRIFKYDAALEDFDAAEKLVKAPNKYLESTTKIELRKVWALHRMGKDAEAKAILAKAKDAALKEGKQSAAYHVALAVDGGFASEAKDQATADKLAREFKALPEPTMNDAQFGQNYMKACAKSSRHEGLMDTEEYFEDKGDFFRAIIKDERRSLIRQRKAQSS
jgi:hypothetical protein